LFDSKFLKHLHKVPRTTFLFPMKNFEYPFFDVPHTAITLMTLTCRPKFKLAHVRSIVRPTDRRVDHISYACLKLRFPICNWSQRLFTNECSSSNLRTRFPMHDWLRVSKNGRRGMQLFWSDNSDRYHPHASLTCFIFPILNERYVFDKYCYVNTSVENRTMRIFAKLFFVILLIHFVVYIFLLLL
jgi:hypothetical protein